jgi:hypothetical protein
VKVKARIMLIVKVFLQFSRISYYLPNVTVQAPP